MLSKSLVVQDLLYTGDVNMLWSRAVSPDGMARDFVYAPSSVAKI